MLKAAPQRSRHLAPGDKLGKYEVIRQIAIGGMAELYLARTLGIEGFEKLVVLKRILPRYVANTSFVNMFLNEARLAATLHHPNVTQVYDIGLEDGDYFFAMEYVHGEDLERILQASDEQGVPMSMDAALTLAAGLCAGLHYAHEKANTDGKPLNIVHRDVSPSNVLVSYDGAVKLVDFGIARATSRPGTTEGGLKGKIAYMSPEQCRARATLDRRSDLYSVGALLYELTTGRLPFTGETEYQILNQIVNEDAPPPSTLVPGYPPALEKIVMRALARDVEQRYATALQLQTDVEDFAHESRLRISPLVLTRLMGTLFPTRLEEWDHAKAQGGLFLQRHVVRTLIESGKTPDRSDPEIMAQAAAAAQARQDAAAAAAAQAIKAYHDDDPTAINSSFTDLTDTTMEAPPITTITGSMPRQRISEELPTVDDLPPVKPPEVQPSVAIIAAPEPKPPARYPSVDELMSATPGSLVTAAGTYGGVPEPTAVSARVLEPTERVRALPRRKASPTILVRTRGSSKSLIALIGLVAAAGVLSAVIVMRVGDDPAPVRGEQPSARPTVKMESAPAAPVPEPESTQPSAQPVEAPAVAQPPTPPVQAKAAAKEPEPKVEAKEPEPKVEAKKPEPKVEAKKPEPKVEAKKPEPKVEAKKPEPKVEAKKPEPKKVEPKTEAKKPEPKPEPKKEPGWNADSPFMPVRTEKK